MLSPKNFDLVQVLFSFLSFSMAQSALDFDDIDVPKFRHLKVMQFNTWQSGSNVADGSIKIAKHIILNNPDVVALQLIMKALGDEWTYFYPHPSKAATLSRHEIYNESQTKLYTGHGVTIFIDEVRPIIFFNLYFDQKPFTPAEIAANGFDEEIVELFEKNKKKSHSRYQNLKELLADPYLTESLAKVRVAPVVLAADLHTPSHLDWTAETEDLHYNISYEWPITSILTQQTGLVDSYRFVHQDPRAQPGITWSTVEKFMDGSKDNLREPEERIDFIFYRGNHLKPVNSDVYPRVFDGQPLPNVEDNDWPSDHFALITEFEMQI